jgi:hypothetical protein
MILDDLLAALLGAGRSRAKNPLLRIGVNLRIEQIV